MTCKNCEKTTTTFGTIELQRIHDLIDHDVCEDPGCLVNHFPQGNVITNMEITNEIKDQFTAIMHEAIDTTQYPHMTATAFTKSEVEEILAKYASDIKWNHAGKVQNL